MPDPAPSDKRAIARALAQKAWAENRPLAWFEELYRKAREEGVPIPWDDRAPNPNVLAIYTRVADRLTGRRALKVGCGLGDDAEWLAARGYDVTAFDIAPGAIAECRRRFSGSRVTYIAADLFESPVEWSQAFDLVWESYTLQTLPRDMRVRAIRQIAGYVAPGGHLLVAARARHDGEPEGTLPWPLTRGEIDEFRACGLDEIYFEDHSDREIPPVRRFRACYQREK